MQSQKHYFGISYYRYTLRCNVPLPEFVLSGRRNYYFRSSSYDSRSKRIQKSTRYKLNIYIHKLFWLISDSQSYISGLIGTMQRFWGKFVGPFFGHFWLVVWGSKFCPMKQIGPHNQSAPMVMGTQHQSLSANIR